MGFLNHATNNVIIDAVLTERGRELIANESFEVTSFAFGDDEVDYSLIQKYGLVIGKEKIEKNTPIFEANPNENIALKHPLITFINPITNLSSIPKLIWRNASEGQTAITLSSSSSQTSTNVAIEETVTINNYVANLTIGSILDEDITDGSFLVKVHDSLIKLKDRDYLDLDINNVATYSINTQTAENKQWDNQVSGSFTIYSYNIVSSSSFTKYGSILSPNSINTSIQIIGKSSGATLIIPVTINRNV
jgi:hypothetical protein